MKRAKEQKKNHADKMGKEAEAYLNPPLCCM